MHVKSYRQILMLLQIENLFLEKFRVTFQKNVFLPCVAIAVFALPVVADASGWSLPSLTDPLAVHPEQFIEHPPIPGDSTGVKCAAADYTEPISLDLAVDLALCRNPQVAGAWAAIKIKANAVGESKAAYLPTLSGSVNGQRTHTGYPDRPELNSSVSGKSNYLSGSLRLWDFGARAANLAYSQRLLQAALADRDALVQKTLGNVIQTYFDAVTSRAFYDAKVRTEEVANQTLGSARNRVAHGQAPSTDVLQGTTALAKASLEESRALGAYQKAIAVLAYTIGIPTGNLIDLPVDDLNDDIAQVSPPAQAEQLASILAETADLHPAIKSAMHQMRAAEDKVVATRAEGLPTLDLTGSFYQNGYPGQGLSSTRSNVGTIGIAVTIPFSDVFSRGYKVAGAEAEVEAKSHELDEVRNSVLVAVVKDYADVISSYQNLASSSRLLSAAIDSLASSQRRYSHGAADIQEILSTQALLADAQQERVRCVSDWRSARFRLLASAGRLSLSELNGGKGIQQ